MRIAFVGKGGSGKTTLSALFSRHLARSGAPVLAVDGDINQHLAEALGHDGEDLDAPALGAHVAGIKDFLRGTNPRIGSRESRPIRPSSRRRPSQPGGPTSCTSGCTARRTSTTRITTTPTWIS